MLHVLCLEKFTHMLMEEPKDTNTRKVMFLLQKVEVLFKLYRRMNSAAVGRHYAVRDSTIHESTICFTTKTKKDQEKC